MNIKSIKRTLHNIRFEVYSLLLVLFIFSTLVGIAGFWSYIRTGIFATIISNIGNWWMWALIVGSLGILIDGWVFGDYLYKRIEFDRLMKTLGKSQFVKRLNEIEELSWDLTERDENLVELKKEEYKIR